MDSKIKKVNHCNGPEGPSPTRMDNATVAVNLMIIFPLLFAIVVGVVVSAAVVFLIPAFVSLPLPILSLLF